MTKSIEAWLEAHAPGDVRAFVNANQLRLTAQAETIAKLKADRDRIAEILGPKLEAELKWLETTKHNSSSISMTPAEARELQQLLGAGT